MDSVIVSTANETAKSVGRKKPDGRRDLPEYGVWRQMSRRCKDKTIAKSYADKGITVCHRWKSSFWDFYHDMGSRPSDRHSIDRANNDLGYWCGRPECSECGPLGREPNCRWATDQTQNDNRSISRTVTIHGETMTFAEACKKYAIRYITAWGRIKKGMSEEEAFTTPVPLRTPIRTV